MKKLLLAIIIGIFFSACNSSKVSENKENLVRLTIASQKGDCIGVAPQKCLIIKTGDSQEWSFFYYNIENFKYQEGYEYVIDVRKKDVTPTPADGSSFKYVFVKEISKTQKQSQKLPRLNN